MAIFYFVSRAVFQKMVQIYSLDPGTLLLNYLFVSMEGSFQNLLYEILISLQIQLRLGDHLRDGR